MIVVAGKLVIRDGKRDEFVARSTGSVRAARANEDCLDFAVSADPIDENRVNIFEEWRSRDSLDKFRGSGPADDLFDLVESFDVKERELT